MREEPGIIMNNSLQSQLHWKKLGVYELAFQVLYKYHHHSIASFADCAGEETAKLVAE